MITCPVCEHPQADGAECEVCGKRLVKGVSAAERAIPAVEGLEPTLHAPADVPLDPAAVVELEPTLHAVAAIEPSEIILELEATHAPPVDVEVAPVPDVERTSADPAEGATAVPAFVTCRYCRTPAMPGERLCARCGMKLPIVAPRAPDAGGAAGARRVCTCGTVVAADAGLCPSCGARLS